MSFWKSKTTKPLLGVGLHQLLLQGNASPLHPTIAFEPPPHTIRAFTSRYIIVYNIKPRIN